MKTQNLGKLFLILLILFLTSSKPLSVYADVPSVEGIQISSTSAGTTLNVTVRHGRPMSNHYVAKIEVKIGEDVTSYDLQPQSEDFFNVVLEVSETEVVMARAFCNQHGWSDWVTEGSETEIKDEPGNSGIPGFFPVSVALGLISYSLLRKK